MEDENTINFIFTNKLHLLGYQAEIHTTKEDCWSPISGQLFLQTKSSNVSRMSWCMTLEVASRCQSIRGASELSIQSFQDSPPEGWGKVDGNISVILVALHMFLLPYEVTTMFITSDPGVPIKGPAYHRNDK